MIKKIILSLAVGFLISGFTAFAACEATLTAGDSIKFDKKEIVIAKSCKKFKINLIHNGKSPKQAMGHNVVILKTADISAIGVAAAGAGPANEYVPKSSKVIAASKLIGGGEKTSVTFNVAAIKGDYSFLCTFPGHWAIMKGKLIVK